MSKREYPRRGDLVWLTLDPSLGHEQKGRRPVLIISDDFYNEIGLCVCVPITSKIKGYPYEVRIDASSKINGAILINQIRNVDWQIRRMEFIEKISKNTMSEVEDKLEALLVLNR